MTTSLAASAVRVICENSSAIEHLFNQKYVATPDGYAAGGGPSTGETEPVAGQEQLAYGLAKHLDGNSASAEGSARASAGMGEDSGVVCSLIDVRPNVCSRPDRRAPKPVTDDARLSGIETREQKHTQPQDAWHLGSI